VGSLGCGSFIYQRVDLSISVYLRLSSIRYNGDVSNVDKNLVR